QDRQMVVTITNSGYIKSIPSDTYKKQRRGGVGITGMGTKEGDWIEHLFVSSTHDYLLFFTNRGKIYRQKVYELPEGARTARGSALVNVLEGLGDGERVQSVLSTRDFTEGKYVVFATRKGMIKKTDFLAYNTPIKSAGIIAIKIRDDDELVAVRRTSGDDELIMISKSGQAVRFNENQVRGMGRDTSGVKGMNVSQEGNQIIAMDVAEADRELLVITENGYGKRTPIDQYRETKRGAMGVKTIKLTDERGGLAGALVVKEHQELVFVSQGGMIQRTSVRGISQQGRATQGVRVMKVKDDDIVAAVALIAEDSADGDVEDDGQDELAPVEGGQEEASADAPAEAEAQADEVPAETSDDVDAPDVE
ncbi:MAG: DNA gyrase C-terminal beta-propeller domain-containing protein, partial [Actinomycetes bacterium]